MSTSAVTSVARAGVRSTVPWSFGSQPCEWLTGHTVPETGVLLHAPVSEAEAGVGLVLREGPRGAAAELADVGVGEEPLDLLLARRITLVPLALDAARLHVIVPVLRPVLPRVLVPDDDLGRMEEIVAVRERAHGQADLLADEVEIGIVRHFLHEVSDREEEVRGEKAATHRSCAALPVRDLARPEQHNRLFGEAIE